MLVLVYFLWAHKHLKMKQNELTLALLISF